MKPIAIIDYGVGNLKSIANMLRKTGVPAQITSDQNVIATADKLILPGVGAFDSGMLHLKESGLIEVLEQRVLEDKIPVLGICVGMQMFANSSEEGDCAGLGWIDGIVKRFEFQKEAHKSLKVPHMGWNYVKTVSEKGIFKYISEPMRFYFVHSYHYVCHNSADVLARTFYGDEFVCSVRHENIVGVQFHPEKSHKYGMQLLKNFAENF